MSKTSVDKIGIFKSAVLSGYEDKPLPESGA